nr:hypothetical protein [Oceanococcus sp. HetDA_MAG_MS8]
MPRSPEQSLIITNLSACPDNLGCHGQTLQLLLGAQLLRLDEAGPNSVGAAWSEQQLASWDQLSPPVQLFFESLTWVGLDTQAACLETLNRNPFRIRLPWRQRSHPWQHGRLQPQRLYRYSGDGCWYASRMLPRTNSQASVLP